MSDSVVANYSTGRTSRKANNLDLGSLLAIERQVQQFRKARALTSVPVNLAPYLECLPQDLREIAAMELMLEVVQQQQQDRMALLASCEERLDKQLMETCFGTSPSRAESIDSEWPHIYGFRLTQILGQGGSAVVFLAIQLSPNRTVAIKVPRDTENGLDLNNLRRFYAEAKLQSKYLGSGVPAVFAFGLTELGSPYIAMELVHGKQLETYFQSDRTTFDSQRDGIRLIEKIAHALAPIHADGNSHLDLSPANVFIQPDGQVKILDFGFGHDSSQGQQTPEAGGTLSYMAPEKAMGDVSAFSTRCDVFSLGAFLARMMTSEDLLPSNIPNDEKLRRIAAGDFLSAIERIRQANRERGVPMELTDLAIECLSADPAARPADASIVAKRIDNYFRSEEKELHKLQIETATQRVRSQIMIPAFATVLGILLIGTIVSVRYAVLADVEKQTANAEKVRASRNAELRLAALDDVVHLVANDSLRRAGQIQLQRELLERVRPRIEDVLRLNEKDEATRQQQGLAWNSLTVIRQAMHEYNAAQVASNKAESVLRDLCLSPDASPSAKLALAIALSNQALLLGQLGKLSEAIPKAQEATERLNDLIANKEYENHVDVLYRAAISENNWANCLLRSGAAGDAPPHYAKAIEHIESAAKMRPNEVVYRAWHAKLLSNLLDLFRSSGNTEKAESYVEDSLRVAQSLKEEFPTNIDSRECLAVCLTNVGLLRLETENAASSVPQFEEALKLYSSLYAQVPEYGEFKWGTAMSESNIGAALMIAGPSSKWTDAQNHLKAAEKLYEELHKSMPGNAELQLYIDETSARLQQLEEKLSTNP